MFFSEDESLGEELSYRKTLDFILVLGIINVVDALFSSIRSKMAFVSWGHFGGVMGLLIIGLACVSYSCNNRAVSDKSSIMNKYYSEYDMFVFWILEGDCKCVRFNRFTKLVSIYKDGYKIELPLRYMKVCGKGKNVDIINLDEKKLVLK